MLVDKEEVIRGLREKLKQQLVLSSQVNGLHLVEVGEFQVKVGEMQGKLANTALKDRNINQVVDKENAVLKENLLRQC